MDTRKGYYIQDQYAAHFVTFSLVGWIDLFTRKECVEIVVDSLNYCIEHKGLNVHAYVIMSSHIHLVLSAREESTGLSDIIRDMRKFTAKKLLDWVKNSPIESRKDWLELVFQYHAKYYSDSSNRVWQRGFHPKVLLHPRFTMNKIQYIHNNPVATGIVREPEDYVYSSASDYVGLSGPVKVSLVDFGSQEGYVFL